MKINLKSEQIKEIAELLDSGLKCYYNKRTEEIKSIIDFDSWIGADGELWEDELRELDENWPDYVEFEKMPSREAFLVMADFAESVDNLPLQNKLNTAFT